MPVIYLSTKKTEHPPPPWENTLHFAFRKFKIDIYVIQFPIAITILEQDGEFRASISKHLIVCVIYLFRWICQTTCDEMRPRDHHSSYTPLYFESWGYASPNIPSFLENIHIADSPHAVPLVGLRKTDFITSYMQMPL